MATAQATKITPHTWSVSHAPHRSDRWDRCLTVFFDKYVALAAISRKCVDPRFLSTQVLDRSHLRHKARYMPHTRKGALAQTMRWFLVKGFRAFRSSDFREQNALYESLAKEGQQPQVMLISCADSRVDPTDIFHAYPGEMFVLRNVANVVPMSSCETATPGTAAALEYATTVLGVRLIVVMGHESCGGIKGCLDGVDSGYVGTWLQHLKPARDKLKARNLSPEDAQYEMELEGVRQSINNLESYDFIKSRVDSGELVLEGAYFSIADGMLRLMNDEGTFVDVDSAH